MYVNLFTHPLCLPAIQYTHAQGTFDCALLTLPPSLHAHIWPWYLVWAELKGGMATMVIYWQYLAINLSLTKHYVSLLLHGMPSPDADEVESDEECSKPKTQFSLLWSRSPTHVEPCPCPLEAANFLLSLAWGAAHGMWAKPEPCYWTEHDMVLVWTSFFFSFGCTTHILGKIRPNKESKAESEGSIQREWYLHALMHITCFGNTTCFCMLNLPHLVVQSLNMF